MRKVVLAVVILLLVSSVAAAADPPVPQYRRIKPELDMVAGALEKTIASTILFTYVPGYGAVFTMTVKWGVSPEEVRTAFTQAARFFVPSLAAVPDDAQITFAARYDYVGEWEYLLTLNKSDSDNPDAWTWYFSQGK